MLKITLEASFLTLPKSARRDNTRSVTPTPRDVSQSYHLGSVTNSCLTIINVALTLPEGCFDTLVSVALTLPEACCDTLVTPSTGRTDTFTGCFDTCHGSFENWRCRVKQYTVLFEHYVGSE